MDIPIACAIRINFAGQHIAKSHMFPCLYIAAVFHCLRKIFGTFSIAVNATISLIGFDISQI